MITTIIFSFDRSMQLDLLLESISKFDTQKILDLHIVYAVSNNDYEKGYELLKGKYYLSHWHKETQFKQHFVWPLLPMYWHNYFWWFKYKFNRYVKSNFNSLIQQLLKDTPHEFAMFLTDDSLFVEPIKIQSQFLSKIRQNNFDSFYSLRHGKNLFGGKYSEHDHGIESNRIDKHEHPEWDYPFSVDGHIYSIYVLRKLFGKIIFKNPNTLEGNIAHYAKANYLFKKLFANEQSCLLGFELNKVQTISNNNNLDISNKTLNDLYLDGYSLNLDYKITEPHFFRPELNNVTVTKNDQKILLYGMQ